MRDILRATWVSIFALLLPLGFALTLISDPSYLGFDRLFALIPGGGYHVNAVLLLLMSTSQVTLLIMLVAFVFDLYRAAFDYHGNDHLIRVISHFSLWVLGLMCLALCLYLGFLVAVFSRRAITSVEELFRWGRLVLLTTFGVFLFLDVALWAVARRTLRATSGGADGNVARELADNDRVFARSCALLVDVPVLLVAGGALGIGFILVRHGRYDAFWDPNFVSRSLPGTVDSEIASLFLNGLEAGITIALMIFSQIEFLFLKTLWASRRHALTQSSNQTN